MFIDPDECIDCGACQPVCPADAIYPDDDAPAEDTARNARFFARALPAR
jgi:ferredoxin